MNIFRRFFEFLVYPDPPDSYKRMDVAAAKNNFIAGYNSAGDEWKDDYLHLAFEDFKSKTRPLDMSLDELSYLALIVSKKLDRDQIMGRNNQ